MLTKKSKSYIDMIKIYKNRRTLKNRLISVVLVWDFLCTKNIYLPRFLTEWLTKMFMNTKIWFYIQKQRSEYALKVRSHFLIYISTFWLKFHCSYCTIAENRLKNRSWLSGYHNNGRLIANKKSLISWITSARALVFHKHIFFSLLASNRQSKIWTTYNCPCPGHISKDLKVFWTCAVVVLLFNSRVTWTWGFQFWFD